MLDTLLLATLQTSTQIAQVHPIHPSTPSAMTTTLVTQPLTLRIWRHEPQIPVPGLRPGTPHPVGFAAIDVTFENKTERELTLDIETIAIYPIGSHQPLMQLPPRTLVLHPMEIAPQVFQLSNQTGYGKVKQVEAVIVYQIEGDRHTLRSQPVAVQGN